jgi:alpha-tubulin suppressor-like RCC1 family protein
MWMVGRDTSYHLTKHHSPQQVGEGNHWVQMGGDGGVTIALRQDGTLWRVDYDDPVQIERDNDWVQVACSLYRSAALKSDGTICNLGRGFTPVSVISRAGDEGKWVQISGNNDHIVALTSRGWVYFLDWKREVYAIE